MQHYRLAFLWALALAGCSIHLGGEARPLEKTTLSGKKGPTIAIVDIEGLITESPEENALGSRQPSMVARVQEVLDATRNDSKVQALVLRIHSPGGTVSASELIHHEVMRWKKETQKPVYAYLEGTATSGGYYVAVAADRIYANPATVTGSIGVILWNVDLVGLMEKIGIADRTFTTGKFKDTGSPLRSMVPAEREYMQAILDEFHGRFEEVVREGRNTLDSDDVRSLADGRIYTAKQAKENGLIDEIGHFETVVSALRHRMDADQVRVIAFRRRGELRENVYTRPVAPRIEVNLLRVGGRDLSPGFYYLWTPGWR